MRYAHLGSRVALLAGLGLAAQACDRDQVITAPASAPTSELGIFTCTADVTARTLQCGPARPHGSGIDSPAPLMIGSQGSYLRLAATNVQYLSPIFSANVTIQNLMGQSIGTRNGSTLATLDAFFSTNPTTTGGTGNVTVANADGTANFTASNQTYYNYNQIVDAFGGTSSSRNWQFQLDPTVTTFTFQVLVAADVPFQGTILRWADELGGPDNTPILSLWGSDSNNVFGVTSSGSIMRYDGKYWSSREVAPSTVDSLMGVWGSGPSDVWAVGMGGAMYHYAGLTWSSAASPTSNSLNAVWGSSGSDVWAVGDAGTILHNTGTGWTVVTLPAADTNSYYAIWGTNSSNIWAVGSSGAIIYYNGSTWSTPQASGTTSRLSAIWGSSATDIYAVGKSRALLHSTDGSTWAAPTATLPGFPTGDSLTAVWGTGPSNVWLGSTAGYTYHYTGGASWTANSTGISVPVRSIWGASATAVWTGSDFGYLTTSPPSSGSWTAAYPNFEGNLNNSAVAGTSASDVWVVGSSGSVNHWNGSSWTGGTSVVGGFATLNAIWPVSSTEAWTVGSGGAIGHYSGGSWSSVTSGTTNNLAGVWGSSTSDVWAVGWNGTIDHYTGTWATTSGAPNANTYLYGIWGTSSSNIYAVGYDAMNFVPLILHYNGSSWSTVSTGVSGLAANPLYAVSGTSATDVWVVGGAGVVLHYNGTAWSQVTVGTTATLYSIFPISTSEAWIGGDGVLFRGNTSGFVATPDVLNGAVNGIWATGSTNIYLVGSTGGIFHGNQ